MTTFGTVTITIELRGTTLALPVQFPLHQPPWDAIGMEEALLQGIPVATALVRAVSGDIRDADDCPPEVLGRGFRIRQEPLSTASD